MSSVRVCVVTGANKGIGYEVVRSLLQKLSNDWIVYLTSRQKNLGLEAIDKLTTESKFFPKLRV
jgi:NAD(P)-dependent dehydrogenase (short-subunit alcohol dehydrogenase family)